MQTFPRYHWGGGYPLLGPNIIAGISFILMWGLILLVRMRDFHLGIQNTMRCTFKSSIHLQTDHANHTPNPLGERGQSKTPVSNYRPVGSGTCIYKTCIHHMGSVETTM